MSKRMIDEGALNAQIKNAITSKQDKLTAGHGITISEDNVISAVSSGGLKVLELDVWTHSSGTLTEEQFNAIKENPLGIVIKAQDVNTIALYPNSIIGTNNYLYQNVNYSSNPDKLVQNQVLIDKYGAWTYSKFTKEFQS